MADSPAQRKTIDLNRVAKSLANVRVMQKWQGDDLGLSVDVVFTPQSYTSDDHPYEVTVGVTSAILALDHPAYDRHAPYEATLPPESWSARQAEKTEKRADVKVGGGFSISALLFSAKTEANAEASKQKEHGIASNQPYPIILSRVDGWQIGGRHGDPRQFSGVSGSQQQDCLNGSYFQGQRQETSGAGKFTDGSPVACIMMERKGANDHKISATLYSTEDGFQLRTKLRPDASLLEETGRQDKTDRLRQAFIDICIARELEGHDSDGQPSKPGERINRDLFLSRHEVGGLRRSKVTKK